MLNESINHEQNPDPSSYVNGSGPKGAPAPSTDTPDFQAEEVLKNLSEVTAYALEYVRARMDLATLSLHDTVRRVSFGIWVSFVIAVSCAVGVTFAMYGFAIGIGEALQGRTWLGFAIVGAGFLLMTSIYFKIQHARRTRRTLSKKGEQYEQELDRQCARFGRDMEDAGKN